MTMPILFFFHFSTSNQQHTCIPEVVSLRNLHHSCVYKKSKRNILHLSSTNAWWHFIRVTFTRYYSHVLASGMCTYIYGAALIVMNECHHPVWHDKYRTESYLKYYRIFSSGVTKARLEISLAITSKLPHLSVYHFLSLQDRQKSYKILGQVWRKVQNAS